MKLVIIGTLLLLITFLLYHYKRNNEENFEYNDPNIIIDCVVARYNESVSWINMPEFINVTRFIIYNKGKPLKAKLPSNAIEIMIPNVGKCDHTYLYHIINNYHNLADVTLFVSGRADDERKGPKIKNTMKLVNKTHDTVFIGLNMKVPHDFYNFSLNSYLSANPENQINEGKITKIAPARIRPYGKWFQYYWGNQSITIFPFQSIFAIHKDHIIQHPISYYRVFYEELDYDVNPEAGHYMERSWGMVFSPFPKKCIYYQ